MVSLFVAALCSSCQGPKRRLVHRPGPSSGPTGQLGAGLEEKQWCKFGRIPIYPNISQHIPTSPNISQGSNQMRFSTALFERPGNRCLGRWSWSHGGSLKVPPLVPSRSMPSASQSRRPWKVWKTAPIFALGVQCPFLLGICETHHLSIPFKYLLEMKYPQ